MNCPKKGILKKVECNDGKIKNIATELASQYGIYNVDRISVFGRTYQVVTYNKFGQKDRY